MGPFVQTRSICTMLSTGLDYSFQAGIGTVKINNHVKLTNMLLINNLNTEPLLQETNNGCSLHPEKAVLEILSEKIF